MVELFHSSLDGRSLGRWDDGTVNAVDEAYIYTYERGNIWFLFFHPLFLGLTPRSQCSHEH